MIGALFSPFHEISRGLSVYVKGFRWLQKHPSYFILLLLPMAISLLLLAATWGLFTKYHDSVLALIMFDKPGTFLLIALYYLAKATLYIVLFVMSLIFYMLVLNVISAPIYDLVSAAVEKDLTGRADDETSLWEAFLLMKEELKKVLFIFLVSVLLLLIPGVNIISPLITAFFVGWEFYDFSLARKKWPFKKRLGFVFKHIWSVTGFGLWLLIPGGQMILMPLAVVGGTMLAVEDLNRTENANKGNL